MKEVRDRCDRCNEFLNPSRTVWLELDIRTNTYTNKEVPEKFSQGFFPFGKACSKNALADHKKLNFKEKNEK